MGLKNLLNADILIATPKNKVFGEHIENIVLNEPYFVSHSIYFAESLHVFKDEAKTKQLIEGKNYIFAEIDSIASEMSNKDCYKAIVFLTDVNEAWIDYHSYGDIISAETLNEIINDVSYAIESSRLLETDLKNIKKNLDVHIKDTVPHGARISSEISTLVLRSDNGTVKTKG